MALKDKKYENLEVLDAKPYLGKYSENYKNKVFSLWYKNGKPTAYRLWNMIPDDDEAGARKPAQITLREWITDEFIERAKEIDEHVEMELRARLVNEKVEMLARHAKLGETMQNMGIEYLREHKDEITPATATRMIVEGWRIERFSKGIPDMLDKIRDMTEEELVSEISKLLSYNPPENLDEP